LWENPDLVAGSQTDLFKRVKTFADDSHLVRHLLECRQCGQLYFFEFYEEIDWEDGNDPQYQTYIPVETEAEIEILRNATSSELFKFSPRLQRDFPKEAQEATARWIGK